MRFLASFVLLSFFLASVSCGQDPSNSALRDEPLDIVPILFEKLVQEDLCNLLVKDTLREFALNNRFFIDGASFGKGNVGYRQNGLWYYFSVNYDTRSIRIELVDIDRDGTNEIVIYGDRAQIGTDGGATEHGISIYKIDTAVSRIFNITSGYSQKYFTQTRFCERDVTISPGEILITPPKDNSDPELCKNLTDIPSGYYAFQYGQIRQIGEYPEKKNKK